MKTITVVHLKSMIAYPPVVSLVENLLDLGCHVNLVSYDVHQVKERILQDPKFTYYELETVQGKNPLTRIKRKFQRNSVARKVTEQFMEESDILWTTTALSVQSLGKLCFQYKHVMQLMELYEWFPYIEGFRYWKFPIDEYARRAWKVVVPEVNRAYIEKTWWGLEKTPVVLPNKPYSLILPEPSDEVNRAITRMQSESRKIILYLGIVTQDRNFESFAEALERLDSSYCIYMAGRPTSPESKERLDKMLDKYGDVMEYLGYFPAPQHLHLLNYAYIGLLPYGIADRKLMMASQTSILNSLYCAPNKIFEYAAFHVPMLGTDVPGLIQPFEKYRIGTCCDENDPETIIDAIREISAAHEEMANNCISYYNSVELDRIVQSIIED